MSCKQIHGFAENSKPHAVFVSLLAKIDASNIIEEKEYSHLKSKNLSQKLLMVYRWDGRIGFPGGKVEDNETFIQAAERELLEEVGLSIKLEDRIFCSYELKSVNIHVYKHDLGVLSFDDFKELNEIMIRNSKTYVFEVCPVWVPFDKSDSISLERLLGSNNLVSSVKETLSALLD